MAELNDLDSGDGCIIEKVEIADAELAAAYARLIPQLNLAHPSPSLLELEQVLAEGVCELFTARFSPGGAILGVLALVIFRTPTGTHAWIEDVVVEETARGRGLGEALTRAALARAEEHGAKAVNLTSRPSRTAANRLYLKIGFELRQSNLYRYFLKKY